MISVFITATKPLFTPKNVEFWTEWVGGNDSLLATRLIAWGGGGGGGMKNQGMNPKPIIGSKVLCNNYVLLTSIA